MACAHSCARLSGVQCRPLTTCQHRAAFQRTVSFLQQACRPRPAARRTLMVTSMSKRGPKSERRMAKQESGPAATQDSGAPEPQPQRSALEESAQPRAATPLADQPVSAPDDGAVTVGDRILPRILLFSGLPVALGLLLLPGFWYLKVVKGLEVPTFVVYIASFIFFGAGLAGITYGIFSASWDPRREGSLTGLDEFKENIPSFTDKKKGR